MLNASLLILQGRDQGARVRVPDETLQLGRGADNDFRVLDSEVSRHHARIIRRPDGGCEVEDLGSSNGTFVNGRAVRRQQLTSGDQLQLGRTVLLYECSAPTERFRLLPEGQIDLVADEQSRIVSAVAAGDSPSFASSIGASDSRLADRLQTLYEISELVTSPSTSIDDVLQRLLDKALESVRADRGCLLVADARTDEIRPRVFSRRASGVGRSAGPMPISTTIVQHVLGNKEGVQTSDARRDERFTSGQSILRAGIREAMCVPLQGRYELLGVLYVDTTGDGLSSVIDETSAGRFSGDALKLLAAVGRQAALAVESHRYQSALVSAERLAAVGQTVTTLAHDMKNILQGMKGGSYLIETALDREDPEAARRGLMVFDRNQDRLYNLATDMLAFSRERRPDLAPCDVNALVQEIGELVRPVAEERRIQLIVEEGEIPMTAADEAALHRAVLNIVTNALDAAGGTEDAAVRIRTSTDEEHVEIAVTDNGPGLSPDEQSRIFNLFETSKGAGGTGIGLAVSQKIMREHGGSIVIESRKGRGATFRLQLPTRQAEDSAFLGAGSPTGTVPPT